MTQAPIAPSAGPSLEDIKREVMRRANARIGPFDAIRARDAQEAVDALASLDADHWAQVWCRLGQRHEAQGDALVQAGAEASAIREAYELAFEYFRIGRYPCPSTPGKQQAYRNSLRAFHKAARYFDPPLEVVHIAFDAGELTGYLQLPRGVARPPVVLQWGGVDGWKEDRQAATRALNERGIATLSIDMPGTGQSPVRYIDPRAQASFSAWIDHLAQRCDLDGSRIGVWGGSFGGYWAARLAYVEAARLKAAVFHGGSVHYGLQREWLVPALTKTASTYLFGPASLLEARSLAMGLRTLEEVLDAAPKLSLVTLGLIDRPSAPILGVNGKLDDQAPVEDIYLLMEHGTPKEARIFANGGHMGRTPGMDASVITRVIADWLRLRLGG